MSDIIQNMSDIFWKCPNGTFSFIA